MFYKFPKLCGASAEQKLGSYQEKPSFQGSENLWGGQNSLDQPPPSSQPSLSASGLPAESITRQFSVFLSLMTRPSELCVLPYLLPSLDLG